MPEKVETALRIRDAALAKIRAEGAFERVQRVGPLLTWRHEKWIIALRSPFQNWPEPDGRMRAAGAAAGVGVPLPAPWALDIWSPAKVFSLEWNEADKVSVITFKRGDWESEALGWRSVTDV